MHESEPSDGVIISTTDAPQGVTGHNGLMHGRRHKRLTNRLGKQGFTFLRREQGYPHLVTVLVTIPAMQETHHPDGSCRAFTFPRTFLAKSGPRVIADAILAQYARSYGTSVGSRS